MKAFVFMLLAVFGLALAGCNTAEGVGEDIENAGDAVKDAAD